MSKIIISLCAFVMLAIAPSVRADTIVITSGTVTLQGAFGGTFYSLAGQNFSLVGAGEGGSSQARNCIPCLAGSSIGTSTIIMGSGLGSANVTINGMTSQGVSLRGTMQLGGGGFIVPMAFTNVTLTSGASLSASIFGCPGPFSPCDNPIFSTTLQGTGMATLNLTFSGVNGNGTPLFFFQSLVFDFGRPKETPEPMTITLLAAGVVGLGAKLRLSHRTRRH